VKQNVRHWPIDSSTQFVTQPACHPPGRGVHWWHRASQCAVPSGTFGKLQRA